LHIAAALSTMDIPSNSQQVTPALLPTTCHQPETLVRLMLSKGKNRSTQLLPPPRVCSLYRHGYFYGSVTWHDMLPLHLLESLISIQPITASIITIDLQYTFSKSEQGEGCSVLFVKKKETEYHKKIIIIVLIRTYS
jgi:hypothetical protein